MVLSACATDFPQLSLVWGGEFPPSSHQNEFIGNYFLAKSGCDTFSYEGTPDGYMKGVKVETLKYTKCDMKVFTVPLQPLQPLAAFVTAYLLAVGPPV